MPALREPGLGPIVGHITDTTCRLWIRGSYAEDEGAMLHSSRRTLGVVALEEAPSGMQGRAPGEEELEFVREKLLQRLRSQPDAHGVDVFYFRLHREFDRTGTFRCGAQKCLKGRQSPPLKPATRYIAFLGTLTIDDPFEDSRSVLDEQLAAHLPDPNTWLRDLLNLPASGSIASFRTFEEEAASTGRLSFILGSCRYPGLLWKAKEADRIFDPLRLEALGIGQRENEDLKAQVPAEPADFVLMMGDQIYADMMNRHVPIGLADTFEEFQERYLAAFGSWNMRKLLRQVPTYMILDDHEIEDNWSQDRLINASSRKVFNLAIGAYMSYQWSHGPRTFGTRLYYAFECNGYPFFVLDTRTQRYMNDVRDNLDDNHLLGRPTFANEEPGQLLRLRVWLHDQQTRRGDVPKFIVSPSVFVPNPLSAREGRKGTEEQKTRWKEKSDSWPAFPSTRRTLLKWIVDNAIQNVVFLSGDLHCANVAAMRFSGSEAADELRAFSITSSAFYWPFPFADGDPSSYVHDSTDDGSHGGEHDGVDQRDTFPIDDRHTMNYRAWNFTQEDNFCRVDLSAETCRLIVTAIGKNGRIIRKRNWLGRPTGSPVISELNLASW